MDSLDLIAKVLKLFLFLIVAIIWIAALPVVLIVYTPILLSSRPPDEPKIKYLLRHYHRISIPWLLNMFWGYDPT